MVKNVKICNFTHFYENGTTLKKSFEMLSFHPYNWVVFVRNVKISSWYKHRMRSKRSSASNFHAKSKIHPDWENGWSVIVCSAVSVRLKRRPPHIALAIMNHTVVSRGHKTIKIWFLIKIPINPVFKADRSEWMICHCVLAGIY